MPMPATCMFRCQMVGQHVIVDAAPVDLVHVATHTWLNVTFDLLQVVRVVEGELYVLPLLAGQMVIL